MSKYLNTAATALILSALAGTTHAQETAACDPTAPAFPCTIDSEVIESAEQLQQAVEGAATELEAQAVEALTDDTAAEAAAEQAAAEEAAAAEAAAAEQAAAEEAAAAEAAAAEQAEVEEAAAAEAAAAEQAAAEEAAAAEAEAAEQAAADEAAAADAQAAEQAAADEAAAAEAAAAEQAAAEETAAAEAAAAEQAATEEAAAAEAAAAEQAAAEEAAAAEAAAAEQAATEEAAAAEAAAAEQAEAAEQAAAEEAAAEEAAAAEQAAADEAAAAEAAAAEQAEAEALPEETTPTPEETVEDSATAAATAEDAEGEAVEEQTLTEDDVRRSDQDFETTDNSEASSDDDGGLSDFEKALLIGLGALAIGSTLDSGEEVVSNSGDRVVLQNPDGSFRVLKNDDVLLRQPGSNVRSERFGDGSTRTFVTQPDGTEVVTIRNAEGRVLRRALVLEDGSQVELFNDTQQEQAVDVTRLPSVEQQQRPDISSSATEEELRAALQAQVGETVDRTFSLRQVRDIRQVRELAPLVELDTITFQSGSAAIQPDQARELAQLGTAIKDIVTQNPGEVFLIEGHTDAVGSASANLALSDRRAETVALALTEYFDIPAANLVTQGYGESALRVRTLAAEQANRRASLRNITQLLR